MQEIKDIFDRSFKRIFSLSNSAILCLINGLFDTDYPPDSSIVYTNHESTNAALKHHFADVFLIINGEHHYHLEAQLYLDKNIVLRVFEYGFYHAMETQTNENFRLDFPEPIVIYLVDSPDIPPESTLHISFSGQGTFDYHVRSFIYPRHSLAELEQKNLIVLIPFQILRLRAILYDTSGRIRRPSKDEFQQLKEIVTCDIIGGIKTNLSVGNITFSDANKLIDLTNKLYEQILLHYQKRGGDQSMGVMLPGAIELPHDDIIFKLERLEELEESNTALTNKITALTDENTALADENTALVDENTALADKVEKLKARIAELETSK